MGPFKDTCIGTISTEIICDRCKMVSVVDTKIYISESNYWERQHTTENVY